MYCNGTCKYLNERKRKCELTGEKLGCMKQTGSLSFAVHEHRGICKFDNPELLESEGQYDRERSNRKTEKYATVYADYGQE